LTHPLCIAGFRHDLRLTRQLNAFELRHFFLLLDFGGSLRDRTFVPAKKREELRLTLGFGSSDIAREKLEKRLRRYHDLELIRLYDDNSILLTFLLDQDEGEDDEAEDPAYRLASTATSNSGNGSHASSSQNGSNEQNGSSSQNGSNEQNGSSSQNGSNEQNGSSSQNGSNEQNGSSSQNGSNEQNGSNGFHAPRRRSGRVLSQNPEAIRKREEYWAAKAAENGEASSETFGENLRDFASKPPAIGGEYIPDGTQNLRPETGENLSQQPEVSPVRVGSNSSLESGEREFINSSSSGFEFEAEKNLRPETSGQKPPAPTNFNEPPEVAAEIVKVKRAEAVRAVLVLTNDPPVNRHLWIKYWDICYLSGNLPAWEEAQDRLRKAVTARNEEIGVRAAWLTTALRRLLEESDRQVFIPTKVQLAENSSEDIRALLAQSFPSADGPEPEPMVAAPAPDVYQRSKGRITPLSEAYQRESESPEHAEEETE